jgi:brefeldin A-resistance guanine nucleotide exchange factor 1
MSNGMGADDVHSSRSSLTTAGDNPTATRAVSVAIDPVALIITECITVTSAMRKHARWAQSSVSAILGGGAARRPPSSLASLAVGDDADGGQLATRWGLRGKKGKSIQDNPLLSAFARLRSQLKGCRGMPCPLSGRISSSTIDTFIRQTFAQSTHPRSSSLSYRSSVPLLPPLPSLRWP